MNLTQEFLHFADSVFPDATDKEKSMILQSFSAGLGVCLTKTIEAASDANREAKMDDLVQQVKAMLDICCDHEASKDSGEQSFSA